MVQMCDATNRQFCSRIFVLIFVIVVLISMVFFIWDYYFSLFNLMDDELNAVVSIVAILHYCNSKIEFQWNVESCGRQDNFIKCTVPPIHQEESYYIQSDLDANITNGFLQIEEMSCGKYIIFSLPTL